jgi:hypothetical protein
VTRRNKPRTPLVVEEVPATLRLLAITIAGIVASGCEKSAPAPSKDATPPRGSAPAATPVAVVDAGLRVLERVEIPEVRIRPSEPTTVQVTWTTPKGTAVNDEAPFRVRWNRSDGLVEAPSDVKSTGNAIKNGFPVKVQPMPGTPNATLDGEINIVVCDDITHALCVPVKRSVSLGFVVVKDAAPEARVAIPLPAAK